MSGTSIYAQALFNRPTTMVRVVVGTLSDDTLLSDDLLFGIIAHLFVRIVSTRRP